MNVLPLNKAAGEAGTLALAVPENTNVEAGSAEAGEAEADEDDAIDPSVLFVASPAGVVARSKLRDKAKKYSKFSDLLTPQMVDEIRQYVDRFVASLVLRFSA